MGVPSGVGKQPKNPLFKSQTLYFVIMNTKVSYTRTRPASFLHLSVCDHVLPVHPLPPLCPVIMNTYWTRFYLILCDHVHPVDPVSP